MLLAEPIQYAIDDSDRLQKSVGHFVVEWFKSYLTENLIQAVLESAREAVEAAIETNVKLEALDLRIRAQVFSSKIDETKFGEVDGVLDYVYESWLKNSVQLLKLWNRTKGGTQSDMQRFAILQNMIAEVEAMLRSNKVSERTMTGELVVMQNSAIAEYQCGQTQPFIS